MADQKARQSQAHSHRYWPFLREDLWPRLRSWRIGAAWRRFGVTALAWTAARRHHYGKYEQDADKPFESSITCHVKQTPLRNQNRKIFHTQLTYILLFDIYTSRSQIYLTFLRHQF